MYHCVLHTDPLLNNILTYLILFFKGTPKFCHIDNMCVALHFILFYLFFHWRTTWFCFIALMQGGIHYPAVSQVIVGFAALFVFFLCGMKIFEFFIVFLLYTFFYYSSCSFVVVHLPVKMFGTPVYLLFPHYFLNASWFW